VDARGGDGRIAAVTAGGAEREEGDAEHTDPHRGRGVHRPRHRRGEEAMDAEPAMFARLRRRQERLRRLQGLYRVRLDPQLAAVRRLFDREGGDELAGEREHAIELVRALDRHHLDRVCEIHAEGDVPWPAPAEGRGRYPELERHREEIGEILSGCAALAIAGGHVAVLLNRLRLFRVLEQAPELPVFAWSAGAMALAERVVLFHDNPPQGAGNAEVLDVGLGLLGPELAGEPLLPLPHASRRLRLGDPERVGIFARRFVPLAPVTLDPGARIVISGGRVREAEGCERLLAAGGREPMVGTGASAS
jgi:hypothetical protein